MAKLLKLRRGTTTQHGSFTGAEGEVTIDTTKDTAVVHDGSQAGGRPLAREDLANVSSTSIVNSIGTSALAGTKVSPDFGSQDITTTGKVKFANVYTNESDLPSASTYHGMFAHVHSTGLAYYAHGGSWHKLAKNDAPDFTGGIDVTGAITATGDTTIGGTLLANGRLSSNNDYAYFANSSTSNASLTLKKSASGADSIDYLQCRDNSNTLKFRIGGDGNIDVVNGIDVTGNMTVTGTVDGRDIAADGTKLDGIESGATADQTKSDIDGLNINADQVDGMHANEFLAVAGDTATGDITFSGGAGAITLSDGSDIRLTNSNSSWTGDHAGKIQHYSNHMYFQNGGGNWIFRNNGGTELAYLDSSGNFVATGNVTAYSDERLKTDISTINDALSIVGKLRGVSYKWLADGKAGIGVIAQEVEEVIPEVVLTNRQTNPSTGETTEIKSVDYGKIVGVLINAINELKAEVDALKKPKKKGGK